MRKVLALLLTAVILLTACTETAENSAPDIPQNDPEPVIDEVHEPVNDYPLSDMSCCPPDEPITEEPELIALYGEYPLFSESAELLELTEKENELINLAISIHPFFNIKFEDGKAFISMFNLPGENKLLSKEEETIFSEKYPDYAHFFRVAGLDEIYEELFSRDAVNIEKVYNIWDTDENILEDGELIGIYPFGFSQDYYFILHDKQVNENSYEFYFKKLAEDEFRNIFNDPYAGYDEDGVFIRERFTGEYRNGELKIPPGALDDFAIINFTFIPEDGTYKIFSIEKI